MQFDSSLSNAELLARMPVLALQDRAATADVIEHLMEIDRRKLFLGQACSSLSAYCRERLGYSEDEAAKRVRVARLARAIPRALNDLRAGHIHLTGLFLLAPHANSDNAEQLLNEARGKSRREIERLLAAQFPRAYVEDSVKLRGAGTRGSEQDRLEPLSAASYLVQFSASTELCAKIERARELLSHSNPQGELAPIFERALDELILREEKKRLGAGTQRKRRSLKAGSRHVPVAVARAVWQRDCNQCTFVDAEGRRCSERRFITIEHRIPYARGGAPTVDNLCLLCSAHNAYTAGLAFGVEHIERKLQERRRARRRKNTPQPERSSNSEQQPERLSNSEETPNTKHADSPQVARVLAGLCGLGFGKNEASKALAQVVRNRDQDCETMLRAALSHLVPSRPASRHT
ncbi:MAG: HNH endonuclease [Myxococcota bacterium]